MKKEFLLEAMGIGDLTFFVAQMLYNKVDSVTVSLSNKVLDAYKAGHQEQFSIFVKDFLIEFLGDKVTFCNNQNIKPFKDSWDTVGKTFSDPNILNFFKQKYTQYESPVSGDYIVFFTKTRDYHKKFLQRDIKSIINKVNKSEIKIVLLGEQEICSNPEYKSHGDRLIYSNYRLLKKELTKVQVVDLTVKTLNYFKYDVKDILKDMAIIAKAKKVVFIGTGGFFCTSLYLGNALCLSTEKSAGYVPSQINKQIFYSSDLFLRELANCTKKI